MNSEILKIALPSIVSNITVPLLGLIDVAIVGHMGDASYIGAVAVGSMIFNVICWLFGFLRMGTSGMTSQAYGKRDEQRCANILVMSLMVGLCVGGLFVAFQSLVEWGAMAAMSPQADILPYARQYFYICIWGVPASLGLYCLNGWYIGMQNTKVPMMVSIMQNIINIVCSLTLVYALNMKVEGVALGTVIAQYSGFVLSLVILLSHYPEYVKLCGIKTAIVQIGIKKFFIVNSDIFVRTLFLVGVNFMFTASGAKQGAVILAVNTLMYQFFTFYSYVMDGFAYAGEAIGGKYYGAKNDDMFRKVVKNLFKWGLMLSVVYTIVYYIFGSNIIRMLSNEQDVVKASADYMPWVCLIPLAGMVAFVWDGLYIGITATKGMLVSSMIGAIVFFIVYNVFYPNYSNHALWMALLMFLFTRGLVQTLLWKRK